ncbi:MAG: hypothetical protein LBS49_07535, partial [Candidatus Accumulibacter sp.]|nr:hypothetical protein [Accumulibacter sp.]
MYFHPRRAFACALIVSLLAHAGLLFGVAGILPARVDAPAPALTVVMAMKRVVSAGAPSSAPAAVAEEPARVEE